MSGFKWPRTEKKRGVYFLNEGTAEEAYLLGKKGARLCEIARLGITVPNAFIIPIDTCNEYLNQASIKLDSEVAQDCVKAVHELELQTRKSFGGGVGKTPLLLSVRSSPAVHIPGVTILNLGMNARIAEALVRESGSKNVRWVYNIYRAFLQR